MKLHQLFLLANKGTNFDRLLVNNQDDVLRTTHNYWQKICFSNVYGDDAQAYSIGIVAAPETLLFQNGMNDGSGTGLPFPQ